MNNLLPFLPSQLNQVLESINYFMPEIYLSVLFIVVLVTDLLFGKTSAWLCRAVACGGLVLVVFKDIAQIKLLHDGSQFFFSQMLLLHPTARTFKIIIDVFSILLLLYFEWDNKLKSHTKRVSDLYAISIAAILGMHLMVMAVNLLSIYLAVEMVSIASYLMVVYRTENRKGSEAGLKYVLFGAASSAIMLYGISLLYGFSGTLNLFDPNFIPALLQVNPLAAALAIVLFFVGIGFKLSFAPFHFWVPDIYEGAPAPIAAFLATVTKIAAFALLINILIPFIYSPKFVKVVDFGLMLSVVGIATMVVGNFAALWQDNIKRMLAYSSIGHTGFALMAIITFTEQGKSALVFYLIAYGLANIGSWMLATYFEDTAGVENISELKGLGFKYPIAGVCFIILLISLTGLPITAGFYGKFLIFSSVYALYQENHNIWLLFLIITGSVITIASLFYYIKIPLNLFIKKSDKKLNCANSHRFLLIFITIISFLILLLGFMPYIVTK